MMHQPPPPPSPWYAAAAALLLALALPTLPAAAQEPASEFYETVEVNVVNVEVYVTDKKGNPVTGLTLDDFQLFEDGEPVDVDYFYAAAQGRPQAAATGATADAGTPGTLPEPETDPTELAELAEEQRLTVVLFVDNANLYPKNHQRMVELLQESPWFQPNNRDRVLVVSNRGDGSIEVVQTLTTDPEELASALERVAEIPAEGAHEMGEIQAIAREMVDVGQEANLTTLSSPAGFGTGNSVTSEFPLRHIEQFAERKLAKVQATLQAMEQFIDSLAGLPGRKSLVYVSDGLPMRPGEDLREAFSNQFGGGGANPGDVLITDATDLFRRLVEHANANRVTFYTLLAGGGRTRNINLTETQRNLGRVWGERVQALQVGNLKEPMEMIAEDTGGLAFTSPKTFEEDLRRMREDFETFYSLGYSRPYSGEAKKHKLEVRVRDPKLRVRHRESYREKTSEEIMASRTLSNLFFDVEDNPLGVQLEFGEEIDGGKGVRNVQLVVKVPIAHLLLLPQEQFHQGKISIFVAVRDAAGRTSPVQKVPAPIRIPNDKLLVATGQVAAFNITLQMREGEHSVVVGVRDELADVESTVRTVHSPAAATAGVKTGR